MTPGVPSHGSECQTRTYPVLCWICGARIFHFRCSHGTSLLFDELGPPWPLHRDDMLPLERKLEIVVEKTGSKDAAARYIEKQMMTGTIDIAYGRRIQAAWWREPQRRADGPTSPARLPEIVRMDTYAGLEEVVTGIVRDLVAERDVYRLFGFPRTAGAAALLGELGEGRFAQITVHDTALGEPKHRKLHLPRPYPADRHVRYSPRRSLPLRAARGGRARS